MKQTFLRKPERTEHERMHLQEAEMPLLTFPLFSQQEAIGHGFTTRAGGVSEGVCRSLNLSFTRGDAEEAVRENFRRVAECLGVKEEQFVFTDQTHTNTVRAVTGEDAGKGLTRPRDYTDVDGLVTNVPGLVLSVFTADCVPLFFYDPGKKAIGLSHAGWKGTAGRIGEKTIRRMQELYGTDPADLLCGIGPSICRDCYEIGGDVAAVFFKAFAGREKEILFRRDGAAPAETAFRAVTEDPEQTGLVPEGKFHLDLWQANRIVLEEAGVLPAHIAVTDICTCCNPALLFSHRASNGRRGNLGAFLFIKE